MDTNVFVSAIFFGGVPHRILDAWSSGIVALVVSPPILEEYRRVGEELRSQYSEIDLSPFLLLLARHAEVVEAIPLPAPVCRDPDDDKFIACALAAGVELIVSGDKDLLAVDGHRGIRVLRPVLMSNPGSPSLHPEAGARGEVSPAGRAVAGYRSSRSTRWRVSSLSANRRKSSSKPAAET